MGGQLEAPGQFTTEVRVAGTHRTGKRMGLRVRLDVSEKIKKTFVFQITRSLPSMLFPICYFSSYH